MPLDRLHERGCFEPREAFLSALSQWDKNVTKEIYHEIFERFGQGFENVCRSSIERKMLEKRINRTYGKESKNVRRAMYSLFRCPIRSLYSEGCCLM